MASSVKEAGPTTTFQEFKRSHAMKKMPFLLMMTFLALFGALLLSAWVSSMIASALVADPQANPGTTNLQQAPPSDWQKAAASPQTGIPATAKPSTTGKKMTPITDDYTPFTEPFILLP